MSIRAVMSTPVVGSAAKAVDAITAPSPIGSIASIDIDSIKVNDRFRHDLGDVSELAASIVSVGLLNPVTITPDMRLIAGERRIAACRLLGLAEIEARTVTNITEARDFLVAERDENTQRKDMLPSEAAALGIAIEKLERPAALERQASTRFGGDGSGPGTGTGHESREIAAEAVGMSEPTYRRVKQALITSEDDSLPDSVREIARDVVTQIDAGKPIRREIERIKDAKRDAGIDVLAPVAPDKNGRRAPGRRTIPRRTHAEMLNGLALQLAGAASVVENIKSFDDSITKEEALHLWKDLSKHLQPLNRVTRLLKEQN